MFIKYQHGQVKNKNNQHTPLGFHLIYCDGLFSSSDVVLVLKHKQGVLCQDNVAHYELLHEELPLLPGHTVTNMNSGVLLNHAFTVEKKVTFVLFPSV